MIPYRSTTRPYAPRGTRKSQPGVIAPTILTSHQEVNPMRRKSREPHPSGWVIHSAFVPRRDGPRRLEQAFRVLLDATGDVCSSPTNNQGIDHESRRLCQGLDREAGP